MISLSERILASLVLLFVGCHALRDVNVTLPEAIERGEPAVFVCNYNLEGDALYQLKWYKGGREFYRFTPKEASPYKVFAIPGLDVDLEKSNGSRLYLGPVESTVAGKYSCEVSADAPSFHTALVSGSTDVVEIPRHTPSITGIKPKYRLGETLKANCTSRDSIPAANLTWYINEHQASSKYVKPLRKYRTGIMLETSQVGLRFVVNRHHFEGGRLKIRCTASIYTVYWKSTEKSVDEERPRLSINNAVTPNTLGVNQMPQPYDIYPPSNSFYDEYLPDDNQHNSMTHAKFDLSDDKKSPPSGTAVSARDVRMLVLPVLPLLCSVYITQVL